MDELIKDAVEVIAPHFERWEIERALSFIGKRFPLPNDIEEKLYDLLEEYGDDYGLPECWWESYGDIEDVFFELCDVVD